MGPTRKRSWFSPLLALSGAGLAIILAFRGMHREPQPLRFTGGDKDGHRHRLASRLGEAIDTTTARLHIQPTAGSEAALSGLEAGTLDAALVQGALSHHPGVCQLAPLFVEPLHVLVHPRLGPAPSLPLLRGRSLNLSTRDSGTRPVALHVLAFAGLKPGDWVDNDYGYEELLALPPPERPDAIFTVSALPAKVVDHLVAEQGYRFMELNIGEALHLRRPDLHPTEIPTATYGMHPEPVPPQPIASVGPRLLLLGRCDLPDRVVVSLMEALTSDQFARAASTRLVSEAQFKNRPEHPLHPAALAWVHRKEPIWTGDDVDTLENLRSLLASVGVAAFFGWRWLRRRRMERFEDYLSRVSRLEEAVQAIERNPGHLDLDALLQKMEELGAIKGEAIRRHTEGSLEGGELLGAFLAQVADARQHLHALLLHERERREEEALAREMAGNPPASPPETEA
jgi:TRAP-type uncharacterized transport system substrate-binding protein